MNVPIVSISFSTTDDDYYQHVSPKCNAGNVTNWSGPSRAVVVAEINAGWVMFYQGPHITQQVDWLGHRDAEELGILPHSPGIWIWEGTYIGQDEWDLNPQGEFRQPDEDEWRSIRNGINPWKLEVPGKVQD